MNRSDLTHILLHLFVFAFLCRSLSAVLEERPDGCIPGRIVDCSDNEDIVWTTVAHQQRCRILKNRCIFNNVQCYYYKNRKPLLKETTKEECQKLCDNKCTYELRGPVCAKRGDNFCYFKNRCGVERRMCTAGESWGLQQNSTCDKQTTSRNCPKGF